MIHARVTGTVSLRLKQPEYIRETDRHRKLRQIVYTPECINYCAPEFLRDGMNQFSTGQSLRSYECCLQEARGQLEVQSRGPLRIRIGVLNTRGQIKHRTLFAPLANSPERDASATGHCKAKYQPSVRMFRKRRPGAIRCPRQRKAGERLMPAR